MANENDRLGERLAKVVTSEVPGPRSRELAQRLTKHEAPSTSGITGGSVPVFWDKTRGANIIDVDGNCFVDITAGFCVAVAGHSNPRIVEAIARQAVDMMHSQGILNPNLRRVELAEKLAEVAPKGLTHSYVISTGSEGVENAIKAARVYTGRHNVIAFWGGYHGKLGNALTATSESFYRERFVFASPGVAHVPYPDVYRNPFGEGAGDPAEMCGNFLQKTLEFGSSGVSDVAAIIMEPVQGLSGWIVPPSSFVRKVRQLCDKHNILMIADEVICGFGRTGNWFGMQHHDVVPDLVVCGKGMASGFPVAAVLSKPEIFEKMRIREPGSTFQGNPVAAAAALASISFIQEAGLVQRSKEEGAYFLKRLQELKERHPLIGDVRGVGLMVALEFVKDRKTKEPAGTEGKRVVQELLKRGVMSTNYGGYYHNVMKMSPPLVITREQIDFAVEQINSSISVVEATM
jgi:4-aminobutyrate aminotransferase / (S)-3-amino-2-methylpropionate transaminase / 5-aminovalerate transaminase